MSPSLVGVLLVCVSSLAFSVLDLARKVLVARVSGAVLLVYLSAGQLPFFGTWLLTLESVRYDAAYLLPAAGSIVLNLIANLLFMEAVRISPLSQTVPFLSFTPVFTTMLGMPLLGEFPRSLQWLGTAVVVAGALQLNRKPGGVGTPRGLWQSLSRERGSLLMVVVAFAWSLAMPLDKIALSYADVALHGLVLNVGVAFGLAIALALRGRAVELWRFTQGGLLLPVAILASVVGLGVLFLALGFVWVSVVETLRRAIGSVAALVAGRWVFGEPITGGKVAGIALMAAGVALILL